jgi:DNA-binding beta-propeller fold protein YncE
VVSNTGESSVCIIDARRHEIRARLQVGPAPAHLAFSPDNQCAFIGCESSDEVVVIDLRKQTILESVKAGQLGPGSNRSQDEL